MAAMEQRLALLVGLVCAAGFTFEPKHICGVCQELRSGLPCERFGACGAVNESELHTGCARVCQAPGERTLALEQGAARNGGLELRVTRAFGTKGYDLIRVSVISDSPEPPTAGFFDYSAQFVHRWTHLYLHTTVKQVVPGTNADLGFGGITVRLPVQGAGVAGLLIADPCVNSPTGKRWVSCEHGEEFQTSTRTPQLINAFAGTSDTDFWSISGDNFYDRTGEITLDVFSRISLEAKSKIFATVPGNHDYWVMGAPEVATVMDQCGNGFMQFYGQDVKAAEDLKQGSLEAPFDFSIDPGTVSGLGCHMAAMKNFLWYNQIGNIGLVGQSGAFSLGETLPFMTEACTWLSQQPGLDIVLLLGHWDIPGLGASKEMAMPQWYTEMAALPGCAEFQTRGMLKFAMGHTHCNDPHPHGQLGAGFRVAGFGMGGCGNYGMPIVDTTGGRVRFWYFDTMEESRFDEVLGCLQQQGGWRGCTALATLWLDEPIVPKAQRGPPLDAPPGLLDVLI